MKAHHRGWFTPFPPFFQYFGLSSKFKHLLLLLAKCSSIYFVYKSKVHRGRMCYIVTLWRFLASVSPPVQGGVGGGSSQIKLFQYRYSYYIFYKSDYQQNEFSINQRFHLKNRNPSFPLDPHPHNQAHDLPRSVSGNHFAVRQEIYPHILSA